MDTIHKESTKLSIWLRKLHKKILNYKLGSELNPHAMRKPLFFLIKNKDNKKNESSVIGFAKRKKELAFKNMRHREKIDT